MAVNQDIETTYFSRKVINPVRRCYYCQSTLHTLPVEVLTGIYHKMDLCPQCDKSEYQNSLDAMGIQVLPPMDKEDLDEEELADIPLTWKHIAGLIGFILSIVIAGNIIAWVVR